MKKALEKVGAAWHGSRDWLTLITTTATAFGVIWYLIVSGIQFKRNVDDAVDAVPNILERLSSVERAAENLEEVVTLNGEKYTAVAERVEGVEGEVFEVRIRLERIEASRESEQRGSMRNRKPAEGGR